MPSTGTILGAVDWSVHRDRAVGQNAGVMDMYQVLADAEQYLDDLLRRVPHPEDYGLPPFQRRDVLIRALRRQGPGLYEQVRRRRPGGRPVEQQIVLELVVSRTHGAFGIDHGGVIEMATRDARRKDLHQLKFPADHVAEDCPTCGLVLVEVVLKLHMKLLDLANAEKSPPKALHAWLTTAAMNSYIDVQRSGWSLKRIERDTPPVARHAGLSEIQTRLLIKMMYFVNSQDRVGDPWPLDRWSVDFDIDPSEMRAMIDEVLDAVRECCSKHDKWLRERLEEPLSARLSESGHPERELAGPDDASKERETDGDESQEGRAPEDSSNEQIVDHLGEVKVMTELGLSVPRGGGRVSPTVALVDAVRRRYGDAAAERVDALDPETKRAIIDELGQ